MMRPLTNSCNTLLNFLVTLATINPLAMKSLFQDLTVKILRKLSRQQTINMPLPYFSNPVEKYMMLNPYLAIY